MRRGYCGRGDVLVTAFGCRERGASLIVSLLMLTAILMIGMSAAHIALQGEKSARNESDRQIALQAAEAALADAGQDLENSSRSHIFAHDKAEGFADGCNKESDSIYLGLCRRSTAGSVPVWQTVDFFAKEENPSVSYGHFTGRKLPAGMEAPVAKLPRYVIELLSYEEGGGTEEEAARNNPVYFYRITAIGFGMRDSTHVVLQTYHRKDDGGSRQTIVPAGRFGWREISNWQELRNANASR